MILLNQIKSIANHLLIPHRHHSFSQFFWNSLVTFSYLIPFYFLATSIWHKKTNWPRLFSSHQFSVSHTTHTAAVVCSAYLKAARRALVLFMKTKGPRLSSVFCRCLDHAVFQMAAASWVLSQTTGAPPATLLAGATGSNTSSQSYKVMSKLWERFGPN